MADPIRPSLRFPRTARLRKPSEFQQVYHEGRRVVGDALVLFCRRMDIPPGMMPPPSRLGIAASRKLGKAHDRNRARRLVREAWRHLYPGLRRGFDVVVNCRGRAVRGSFGSVRDELARLCELGNLVFIPPDQRRHHPQSRGSADPPRVGRGNAA